jgi:hypothetical protein
MSPILSVASTGFSTSRTLDMYLLPENLPPALTYCKQPGFTVIEVLVSLEIFRYYFAPYPKEVKHHSQSRALLSSITFL